MRSRSRSDSGDADELLEETGDLLFALVNLARHIGHRSGNWHCALHPMRKFEKRRFGYTSSGGSPRQGTFDRRGIARRNGSRCGNEAKAKGITPPPRGD